MFTNALDPVQLCAKDHNKPFTIWKQLSLIKAEWSSKVGL